MIKQNIDFDLAQDNTQAIKVSELKKILKVMKVYKEQWLHFNLSDIIIGNSRNIVFKHGYNGANFALNVSDIELLLTIAKTEGLISLFFCKDSNNNLYVSAKCNEYIRIK